MDKEKRRFRTSMSMLFVLILFLLVGWVEHAQSQEKYPIRAIEIIVPATPGGATDLGARIEATYLNKKWGVPVNVVNKPGGNFVPGTLSVYQAAPDGYTVLQDIIASSSLLGVAVKDLPFQIMDRTFIAITYIAPILFCVPPNSPIKTLKDLEAEAKRDPGSFTWTLQGGAAGPDYAMRQFFKAIGLDHSKTKPILCRGGSEVLTLVAGGNVKVGGSTVMASLPGLRGGLMRPLCVIGSTRHPDLPDVPTAIEMGYAVNVEHWFGVSGPPKLPTFVVEKWNAALEEMSKDPEIVTKLKNIGALPFYRNARETREHVTKEFEELKVLWGLK
jgi:tripartite-type tricarboxylate transporter receptor subunit TctC